MDIEAAYVKKQGIIDAKAAEHQIDSVAHKTINHDHGKIVPYIDVPQVAAQNSTASFA